LKLLSETTFLESRELSTEHQRLAEIIEMIHTASLIHDDVIDDSGMRRGTYYVMFKYASNIVNKIALHFLFILYMHLLLLIFFLGNISNVGGIDQLGNYDFFWEFNCYYIFLSHCYKVIVIKQNHHTKLQSSCYHLHFV